MLRYPVQLVHLENGQLKLAKYLCQLHLVPNYQCPSFLGQILHLLIQFASFPVQQQNRVLVLIVYLLYEASLLNDWQSQMLLVQQSKYPMSLLNDVQFDKVQRLNRVPILQVHQIYPVKVMLTFLP